MNNRSGSTLVSRRAGGLLWLAAVTSLTLGCRQGSTTILVDIDQAQSLSADLRVELNKADDASNRAVMANTDEASIAFATEAQKARQAVESDVAALGPLLKNLGFASELRSFDGFKGQWTKYSTLDTTILGLAVENTNLKAQRLSFGAARQAADAFRDAVVDVAAGVAGKGRRDADLLAVNATLAVREIQVLQAPHIAEADDAAMTRIEREMAARDTSARDALKELTGLTDAGARAKVGSVLALLDKFKELSAQIVSLSRQNTNVRSLELSLREKPTLATACDTSLQALQGALKNEGSKATR